MKESSKYNITGKVQGVFFRATAKEAAQKLAISGIVKNLPNGDLYLEAEAELSQLLKFEEFLKIGPEKANVRNIEKEEIDSKNYTSFKILH